jgi:hypothetical protein
MRKGRHDEVGQLLVRGTKYTLLIGFLGTVALLCIGPDFIRVWMGVQYGPSSGLILRIMVVSQFVALTEMMATHLLYGLGKHRINVYCTLAEAVINLGASIVLAKRYGIYGVAAGTTVAAVLVKGTVFPDAVSARAEGGLARVFKVRDLPEYIAHAGICGRLTGDARRRPHSQLAHFLPVHRGRFGFVRARRVVHRHR